VHCLSCEFSRVSRTQVEVSCVIVEIREERFAVKSYSRDRDYGTLFAYAAFECYEQASNQGKRRVE